MTSRITTAAAVIFAGATAMSPAFAQDVKLPNTMAFTAYDTGTSGFNIAVGVGKMMKDKYGSWSRQWEPAATSRRKACSNSA